MKPIVHYNSSMYTFIEEGRCATIFPLDHYSGLVTNSTLAMTSQVIKKNLDGSFETENTMYIPKEFKL